MERIKVPSGSVQKLETVFDTLQTQQETNLINRFDRLVKLDSNSNYSYGIIVDLINGEPTSNDNSFKLTITNGNAGWIIDKGYAITQSKEHVNFTGINDSSARTSLSYNMTTGKYYLVKLYYDWVGSDPVTAMNAFLFDKTGSEPYTSKNTIKSDSWEIRVQDITTEVGAGLDLDTLYPTIITEDEIAIAIVKTHASNPIFDINTFTIDGKSSVGGAIDTRVYNRFLLNYKNLDDQYVLLKDRDSIGLRKLNAKLEVGDDFYVTGATETSPTFIVDYSTNRLGKGTSVPSTAVHIKDSSPILRLHDGVSTLFSQSIGYVDFYKGTEASFDTYDDRLGLIGFTENYSTKFYLQNDTAGDIVIRGCTRDDSTETKTWKEIIWTSGKLGILNSIPTYTVDITGTLRATGSTYLNDIYAEFLTLDDDLTVNGISTFQDEAIFNSDLTVSNDFFIDVSSSLATFGTDNYGTNVEIKNPTGASLKLTIPNTSSYVSSLVFSAGVTNPKTFVLAMDANTQTLRIDKDTEFNYNYFVVDSAGNITLGDYTGTDKFNIVNGSIKITEEEHNKAIKFNTTGPGQRRYDIVVGSIPEDSATGKGSFGIYDYAADKYRFVIDSQGRVGIFNITEPAYTLDVGGSIHATANITTDQDFYGVNANFENITTSNIITDTMTITTMNIGTMYTSDHFQGQTIRWPINLNDVYDEGGLLAGITSDGVVTIGGAAFGANKLDNINTYPDYLRVANSLRIFSTDVSKLVFSTSTVASGISFDYYNDQLQAVGPLGVYQKWYTYDGTPTSYTSNARIKTLTVIDKLITSSANVAMGSIDTNYLTVASVLQATSNSVNITNASINTLGVATELTVTGTTELANLSAYQITASGIVTIENALQVTGDIYCGTTGAQQIVISGSSGQLNFYDSDGERVVWIDDNISGALPGIVVKDGAILSYEDGGGYCLIKSDNIIGNASTTSTAKFGIKGQSNYNSGAGDTEGVLGVYNGSYSASTGDIRCGVMGISTMGGTNTDDSIGVYGSATHTGDGKSYAGYFDGDVKISDDLYVDNTAFFGISGGQRIELDGENGNFYWYNSAGTQIIKIDDDLFSGHPGIGLYGSQDHTSPDEPVVILYDDTNNYVGITPYDLLVKHNKLSRRYCLVANNMSSYAGDNEAVYAYMETAGDTGTTAYNRIGVRGLSTISGGSSNDNAIGVYGSATTAGTGTAWSGYFDNGNVFIKNGLVVTGGITISGTGTWASNLVHTGSNVGFFGVTPTTRKTGYTTFDSPGPDRNLSAVGQDFDKLKGVVRAIIDDLTSLGLFGN